MNKSTIFFSQLLIFGAFICVTTAVSLRHKRNVIAEYHALPAPNPEIDEFPHETTCHYYYKVLSEEDITVQKCPDGELFDYIDHKCSRKETARCWSRHFGKMKHHHVVLKSRGPFRCPYAWGKYPDIKDCTKYYVCLSGKVKHKKCAPYEHFDKVSRKCVAAIEGVCADETDVMDSDYKCPRTWGSFSFPKDCSKYYECLEKKPSLRTCPISTLFHERKEKCVPMNHVHCGPRHNPYSKKEKTSRIDEPTQPENLKVYSNKPIKYTAKETETESSVEIASETKLSTIDPNSIDVERKPDAAQTTQSPKTEKEIKSNVKVASETKTSTIDPNSIIVNRIPSISDAVQSTLSSKDLTTGEFPISDSQDITPLLELNKTNLTDLPSKQLVLNETAPLMDVNTELISVNDTDDEITDEDLGNTDEFIEISTSGTNISSSPETKTSSSSEKKPTIAPKTKTSSSSITQTVTVETKQYTKEDTVEVTEQQTTAGSLQATTPDECSPKDPTCITEEGGRVIRCPGADGLYPYPEDERRFLICEQSNIRVRYCAGDTIFNVRSKKCIGNLIF